MVSDYREVLYLGRAKNELSLAGIIFRVSRDSELKKKFELKKDVTFFSNVISASYYCIFYSAKALLCFKNIETKPPEEHKKTLKEFEKLVKAGLVDKDLLKIYKVAAVEADELLGIFKREKSKRGKFTYRKLPQANLKPARESLYNARKFLRNINLIIKNS